MKYFDKISCPICNKDNYKIYINSKYIKKKINDRFYLKSIYSSSSSIILDQVVKCLNCNFHYINPRPKTNIILKGYSEVQDEEFTTQGKGRLQTFKNSLSLILESIDKSDLNNGLDVGSASGEFLKACKDFNIKCEGIEPSKWLVNYGKKKYGIKVFKGDFLKFSKKKKFNFLSFWDVLEHVADLKKAKSKILKLLNNDGYLIVNVPDMDSYARKILGKKWPFFLSVHLHYLNKTSLLKLFGDKFELIIQKPHWQLLDLSYVFERAVKYFPFLNVFHFLIKFSKIGKIKIKYNMGQTLFVFKRK